MSIFPNPSSGERNVYRAQALVEFALIVPVMLLLTLGLIDLGRAFIFGVSVQEGTRQAARVAANVLNDNTMTNNPDAVVLGRLVAASNPALNGCLSQTTTQSCNGATWTFTVNVDNSANGLTTYTSIDAARLAAKQAQKPLTGAQIKVTAAGSVALLPGVSTGMYGLSLPQIGVQGQSAMVIL
ncbi:MAG: hypothetical protein E6I52_10235 [Chloroflexi bacterium]|nr:MAG: hypothetical protein E6I52_10235 [Chloroflexota bacterium]